jgi:predicted nucleic-acid-binding Zn-ribbon protein
MTAESQFPCLRCGEQMVNHGLVAIVTGGSSSASKFFLGQWAEMNERNWDVIVIACPRCGKVELYDRALVPTTE